MRTTFAFPPESPFTFTPGSRSPSVRNDVHVRPGTAFTFARNPHGEYRFQEFQVDRLSRKDRQELYKKYFGFVFQSYHLLDNLTVYENLEVPLTYRNVKRSEREAIVADMLDRFRMVGKKDLFPNQLSGGQQQLVGVARAMIANPKVLLADEPTGNLHTAQGREIMEMFRQLKRREPRSSR